MQQSQSLADDPERWSLPTPPLRVLAMLPGDDFSGPAGQVASTAAELGKHGVELRFLLLCRASARTGRLPAFLDRRSLRYHVLEDRGPLDVSLVWRVHRLLAAWRPDIVETHGYKATTIALLLKQLRPDWRWVGFFHGLTRESHRAHIYHRLDRWMLARADRVVTPSEDQRRHLARRAPHAYVIHSAVTTLDSVAPEHGEPRSLLEHATRPRLAVIGRLSPEKGQDLFLRAAAALRDRGIAFSALVVGDGSARPALEALAASLGLEDRVRFTGHVGAIRDLYEHIDVLVIPSRSEGLPSVLLEALAADVPVVATRVGAIPEVLGLPGAGILVAPESPHALAEGVLSALATLGDETARAGRAAAARAFSQEKRARALLAMYRELLAPRASARPQSPARRGSNAR